MAVGREELIQANIARAKNTTVTSPVSQPQGQAPPASLASPSSSRNRFGANLDIVQTLKRIQFESGTGSDMSMRGAIAYIRKWSRANTQQQSATQTTTDPFLGGPTTDWSTSISTDLSQVVPPLKDPNNYYQLDPSQEIPFVPQAAFSSQLDLSSLRTRQQSLSASSPITQIPPTRSQGIVSSPRQIATPESASPLTQGPLRLANPSGLLSFFTPSPAFNSPPRTFLGQRPTNQSWVTQFQATSPPDGMWQFLFNPSELEIEAGPEFKSSETWAVSDKANSGQPLHWSHNKNAQLKFNSVLLNGYIFGKQVEDLEQGLYALFMSRDGDGQDGPPVLEFVWGSKVFGPCVIKNINVKEKQWDGGLVVNAELSFTLEQIPEWTINDGFVDVARPGRLATVNDPLQTGTETPPLTDQPPVPAPTPAPAPTPGGGASSSQKPPQNNAPPSTQFCTQATNAYSNFNSLAKKSSQSWTDNIFGSPEGRARGLGIEYNSLLSANRSVIGSVGGLDPKCSSGCQESSYYFKNTATLNTNAYVGCVRSCSYQVASKIQGSYLDDKSCPRPQFITPR